jgi:hypothetical protein
MLTIFMGAGWWEKKESVQRSAAETSDVLAGEGRIAGRK